MKTLVKALICFLLLSASAEAAARTASVTGTWANTATWGGAAAPVSGDTVSINGGITVTIGAGTSVACGAMIIGVTNSSTGTLINNGTLTIDASANVKVGNGGTNQDGHYTFGPDSIINLTSPSNFIVGNSTLDSTATQAHPGRMTGTGAITSLATAKQVVTLSNVLFLMTGAENFVLENTIGLTGGSSFTCDHCVWAGTAGLTIGATDSLNTVAISVTNSDIRDMIGTRIITVRRVTGGAAAFLWQHNVFYQAAALTNQMTFLVTTSTGLTFDGNVAYNTNVGSAATPLLAATVTNNLNTTDAVNSGVIVVSDAATGGSTVDHNYIFSTKDTGANIHPIQTALSGGSGTHTVTYNLLDAYADAMNDKPDMFMAGNTTTVLPINFNNNIVIYTGELVNGAHHPTFGGAGIVIRNNTVAGTIPASTTISSGNLYRPEGAPNTGTITVRSNLQQGNAVTGEFFISGSDSGAAQVIAYSDYNDIFNVATPYSPGPGMGLTVTAGNTAKTVPGSHDFTATPNFFDSRRDMAVWNGIFGSGTATRDAAMAYFDSLNGYRGTPNFDQQGTPTPFVPLDMLTWVAYGYSPTTLTLRGAGDPADGSLDIGAMPVRTKTGRMFIQ